MTQEAPFTYGEAIDAFRHILNSWKGKKITDREAMLEMETILNGTQGGTVMTTPYTNDEAVDEIKRILSIDTMSMTDRLEQIEDVIRFTEIEVEYRENKR